MTTTYSSKIYDEVDPSREDKLQILRTRWILEILFKHVDSSLRLKYDSWDNVPGTTKERHEHHERHGLYAPDTVGRLSATLYEKFEEQLGHPDEIIGKFTRRCNRTRSTNYQAYFVIVLGPEEMPIWIFEGAHRLIAVNEAKMKRIGKKITSHFF